MKTPEELRAMADMHSARALELSRLVVGGVKAPASQFYRLLEALERELRAYEAASDAWFSAMAEKRAKRLRAVGG